MHLKVCTTCKWFDFKYNNLGALQAAGKAARAENVQENVIYEAQLQADHVIVLTGPTLTGRSQKRRGLHISILDMVNARRSIAVPCRGIKASSGLQPFSNHQEVIKLTTCG